MQKWNLYEKEGKNCYHHHHLAWLVTSWTHPPNTILSFILPILLLFYSCMCTKLIIWIIQGEKTNSELWTFHIVSGCFKICAEYFIDAYIYQTVLW